MKTPWIAILIVFSLGIWCFVSDCIDYKAYAQSPWPGYNSKVLGGWDAGDREVKSTGIIIERDCTCEVCVRDRKIAALKAENAKLRKDLKQAIAYRDEYARQLDAIREEAKRP